MSLHSCVTDPTSIFPNAVSFACLTDYLNNLSVKVLRAATKDPPDPVHLTFVVPPEVYPHVKKIPLTSLLSAEKFPVRHRVMRMPLMRASALALSSVLFR